MEREQLKAGISNSDIVRSYIPLVDFISEILGSNCEVVLHDLSNPEASIIAIRNGHLSGRKFGGPLTDFVLKVIKNRSYEDQSSITNYKATGHKRDFRSSSYFIKNFKGDIIGVLCVNIDVGPYIQVKAIMEALSRTEPVSGRAKRTNKGNGIREESEDRVEEKFFGSLDDMLDNMIREELELSNVVPSRMTVNEKVEVVYRLNEKGTFQLKGAVGKVAKAFGVSEPTVYRYLNMGKEDRLNTNTEFSERKFGN
jgi:predicted transcriptional regulator YheO